MNLSQIIKDKNLATLTDKNTVHSYCEEVYDVILAPYRNKKIQLTEIGIADCGSLYLWSNYFTDATILGVDVTLRTNWQEIQKEFSFVTIKKLDAYDVKNVDDIPMSDIIIDDGSHEPMHQLFVVNNYIQKLLPEGMLVIEDISSQELAEYLLRQVPPTHAAQIFDLSQIKGRYDDRVLVIRNL